MLLPFPSPQDAEISAGKKRSFTEQTKGKKRDLKKPNVTWSHTNLMPLLVSLRPSPDIHIRTVHILKPPPFPRLDKSYRCGTKKGPDLRSALFKSGSKGGRGAREKHFCYHRTVWWTNLTPCLTQNMVSFRKFAFSPFPSPPHRHPSIHHSCGFPHSSGRKGIKKTDPGK